MDDINVIIGGLRALLFVSALFSAAVFIQEIDASFSIACNIWRGRFKKDQITGIAAMGWFISAVSCMVMTFNRMWSTVFDLQVSSIYQNGNWDGIWIGAGLFGLAIGCYLPVLSILWYRDKLKLGILIGIVCLLIGAIFGALTNRILHGA